MDEALDKVACNKFMGKIPIYELHPKDGLYNFTLKDIEFSFNLSYWGIKNFLSFPEDGF